MGGKHRPGKHSGGGWCGVLVFGFLGLIITVIALAL